MVSSAFGPDIAIVGAARSGTSFLSAMLGRHPSIDPGFVKEPNYFSSRWSEDASWYNEQYGPRSSGILRLDSSVSYTYPQHPQALERLSNAAPKLKLIYGVREPVRRLVSHYQLFRYYTRTHDWASLSDALDKTEMILGASDYAFWLRRISEYFPAEQILVIPFPLITKDDGALTTLFSWLDLPEDESPPAQEAGDYRNEIREFRSPLVRRAHDVLRRSKHYPKLRSLVGADRLRVLRRTITRPTTMPDVEQELASLTPAQHAEVDRIGQGACTAVEQWLRDQDARHGTDWSAAWSAHVGTRR